MNKEQYLQELRKSLKVLPQEDRDEAIEFYEEYFDDAGIENEGKVIEELGDPKQLGKKILIDIVDRQYAPAEAEQENTLAVVAPAAGYTQNAEQVNVQPMAVQTYAQPNEQAYAQQGGQPQYGAQYAQYAQGTPMPDTQPKQKSSAMTGLKIALAALFAIPLSPILFALLIVFCTLIFVAFIVLGSFIVSGVACIVAGLASFILGVIAMFGHPFPGMIAMGTGLASLGIGMFMIIGSVALIRLLAIGLAKMFGGIVHRKNKKQKAAAGNVQQVY